MSNSYKLYKYYSDTANIKTKSLFELFPNATENSITLFPKKSETIATPIDELAYLAMITACLKPKTVFEIGTYKGRTALNFAANSPGDCLVYTMDLPKNQIDTSTLGCADKKIAESSDPDLEYRHHPLSNKIKQLYANSLTYDFTDFYEKCDIIYIDGGHSYECVSSDTKNALKMVTQGGVIIWHDYLNAGEYYPVTQVVDSLRFTHHVYRIENTQLAILIN